MNIHRTKISGDDLCPDCDGDGKVETEKTVGGCTANGPWQSYKLQICECETCGGRGEVESDD